MVRSNIRHTVLGRPPRKILQEKPRTIILPKKRKGKNNTSSREEKKMSEKTNIEDVEIRGRMDIEDIVKYQINRCNLSSSNPDTTIFGSNVLVLLDLLPAHKREEVIERKKEYGKIVKVDDRDIWCGQRVGRAKWKPPIFVPDYHMLYRYVLDAFADSGLTWNIEQELFDKGKKIQQKKPTPYNPEMLI